MYWLSAPTTGKPITDPSDGNRRFVIMKTPLSEDYARAIADSDSWTITKAIDSVKSLVPEGSRLFAINVSSVNRSVSPQDWENAGISARTIVVNEYSAAAVDAFCDAVTQTGDEPTVFIVYSGRGTNRPAFCISSYFARKAQLKIADALQLCITSFPCSITKDTPLKALESLFDDTATTVTPATPEWYDSSKNDPVTIGNVPLDLVQRTRGFEKISKKVNGAKVPLPEGPERDSIIELLQDGYEGHFKTEVFDEGTLSELKERQYFCTFEPRGYPGFVVARKTDEVFFVYKNGEIWKLKARAEGKLPVVAMGICAFTKTRCVLYLTDLLLIGTRDVSKYPLSLRLAYLSQRFAKDVKLADIEEKDFAILFRPMCALKNIGKLKKDLDLLVTKCDGIGFYDEQSVPGFRTLFPIRPSAEIEVSVNGNGKAVLLGTSDAGDATPIGVFTFKEPKLAGLDLRTSRFTYRTETKEWQPEEIGMGDPPESASYIEKLQEFMDRYGAPNVARNIDTVIGEIAKIEYSNTS